MTEAMPMPVQEAARTISSIKAKINMSKYKTIAVIYGSDSSVWEISCRSGEFTASRIDGSRYDVYEIFARFGQWSLAAYRKRNSVRMIFLRGNVPVSTRPTFP